MKARRAAPRTADLFASLPAVKPLAVAPLGTPARVAAKLLWYAVVFTDLDPLTAEHTLQRLALHAQSFTPFVSIELPNALLLEIRGSVKLFGSLPELHAAIDARWQALSLRTKSATTASTLGALWLARAGETLHNGNAAALPGLLARVPLPCTGWDPEWLRTLRAMGVREVGEALRLPRGGLARRAGPAAVLDLDVAVARQPAPRRAFVPRERFRERCDFESEVEHVAYLEKAVQPLIERCALFLRNRQAGVQRLKLRLSHRQLPPTEIVLGLASVTSDRERLFDVVQQKLSRLALPAAVRRMELVSGTLRALSAASLDAFAGLTGAGGRDTAPQLVERLRARLGETAVYGLCLIDEHRPEAAWRRVSELSLGRPGLPGNHSVAGFFADTHMPRPVWLLEEPLPLAPPELLQGPERIESGWWDGGDVVRDYYTARAQGAKLWVYQERQTQRWFLHGVFA